MNNYNSSSYYRANPYKDIGYMPPMAQKNRRSPQYGGEIPQGEQYFEPSAKKHYGYSYHNQIENDRIFRGSGQMSPLQKQAMQRSYFRSLNSKDIEGSSTNTLISKAVKNKMKAQQELQRRKQIEKQQAEAQRIYQYEQQQKRKKYIQDYHRQVMQEKSQKPDQSTPNQSPTKQTQSSMDQKKRRQAQLLRLAQQRKNYAIVDFPQLQNSQEQKQISNNSPIVQSQPNFHHKEMEKRRKTQYQNERQRQNQKQQAQNNQHQNKNGNHEQETRYEDKNLGRKEHQNDYYRDSLEYAKNRQMPVPTKPTYNIYEQYQSQPSYQPQQKPDSREYYKNDYHRIEKDEMRKYQDYNLPYENINPITQIQKKEESKPKFSQEEPVIKPDYYRKQDSNRMVQNYQANGYENRSDQRIPPQNNTNPYAPMYGSPQPFKNRQDLRRHNPTFLSYGSPTFSIASRNVIGS